MIYVLQTLFVMSVPLLFATLGALISERAGVLAVFMDGAITLSGFIVIAVTITTGNPVLGFLCSSLLTTGILMLLAWFAEHTRANPFLVGLSVNFLATGATSWFSSRLFGTRGVVTLAEADIAGKIPGSWSVAVALVAAILVWWFLKYTLVGLKLTASGPAPQSLTVRGSNPARYRIASWGIAGFFAVCAGSVLAFNLGAYVPNLSAGRGWTALAAVYLAYRKPLPCIAAVLVFSVAEYITTILQGTALIPASIILGLPYALALLVFLFIPRPESRQKVF